MAVQRIYFEKFIFKKADYVIAPNEDNLGYAISYGLKKEKGSVVRYGSLINKKHLINPDLRKDKMFLITIITYEVAHIFNNS